MTGDGTVLASVLANGASDAAGNQNVASTSTDNSVTYDTAAPVSAATSPTYSTSTSFTVTYTATDPGSAASGLADVELWVKGPADASFSKVATDSGAGIDNSFSFSALDGDGSYEFYTRAHDQAGNYEAAPSAADDATLVDTAAPVSAITFPINGGAYSEASWIAGCSTTGGDFCGTANDPGTSPSGIFDTKVSMRRVSTGLYWDGISFASATEVLFPVGSASTWSKAFPYANFPATGQYSVRAAATDMAGNTSSVSTIFQLNRYSLDYLPPLDDAHPGSVVLNKAKYGRVVPVKVDVFLEGVRQTSAQIAAGALTIGVSPMATCESDTSDAVELYADAGSSNAGTNQFRAIDGSWIYNLDTKALNLTVNKCYRLDVYLSGVKISTQTFAAIQSIK
jgi:hypothetical protein